MHLQKCPTIGVHLKNGDFFIQTIISLYLRYQIERLIYVISSFWFQAPILQERSLRRVSIWRSLPIREHVLKERSNRFYGECFRRNRERSRCRQRLLCCVSECTPVSRYIPTYGKILFLCLSDRSPYNSFPQLYQRTGMLSIREYRGKVMRMSRLML